MRRLLAVGTLALGCAAWAMPLAAQTPRPDLAVRLEYSLATEPLLFLAQPAYVALFEMVPGRGIVQLYPLTKYEASYLVEPGYMQLIPARADMARRVSWQSVQAVQQFTPGFHVGVPGPVRQVSSAPQGFLPYRHVIAIASDKPLKVGTPSQTMSYLHLAMPALWSPASFEAGPADLEALIDAVVPAGAVSGVSAIQLATQLYTMATYSPLAFAMYNTANGAVGDEIWANCFGMRIRVPAWYLGEAFCSDGAPKATTAFQVSQGPIGLSSVPAPTGVVRVTGRVMAHEVTLLTPIGPRARGEYAPGAPDADRGVRGGRDLGVGPSAGHGGVVESRAGAPGTTGMGPASGAPRRGDEGTGNPRTASPAAPPAAAKAPAGTSSRELPVP